MTTADCGEAAFLYRIATAPAGDACVAWLPARPLHWDRLIGLALVENAITVLNDRVLSMPPSTVPSEARDRIGKLALVWTFKLKILEKRLADALRILSDARIQVTLLKGAALAHTVYRNFRDRPMADIDLMIDPARAHEAYKLMHQAGWSLDNPMYPTDAWEKHHHLPPLTDTTGSGLRLEIHTAPLQSGHPFILDRSAVLEASNEIKIAGVAVRISDPHFHLVHTAIHFGWSHRFECGALNTFRDFHAVTGSAGFSWQKFVRAAHRARGKSSCYWTVRLAHSLTGLSVPPEVLDELSPTLGESILAMLEEHLSQLILNSEYACPSVTLRNRLWAFALQTKDGGKEEAGNWHLDAPKSARTFPVRALQTVGSHIRRAPQWSRYVTSMLVPVFGRVR